MLSSPATCLGLLVTMHNMHTAAVIINTGRCITTSTAVFGFGRCYALSETRQLLLGPHTAHTISQKPWNFLIAVRKQRVKQNYAQRQAASHGGTQGRHVERQWHCTPLGGGADRGTPPPKTHPPRSGSMHGCC